MGVRFSRNKPRNLLTGIIYRLFKRVKLDTLLDLEWVFNRLANEASFDAYDPSEHPARRNPFLLSMIGPQDRVLDLGCGNGAIAAIVSARAASVTGIDHDVQHVAQAQTNFPSIRFLSGDARTFIASDETFDVLILSHVLEHLDEPDSLLKDVAARFSRIYIEVPDFESSHLNLVRKERGRRLVYSDDDHIAEFDRRELAAMIEAANLQVIGAEYVSGVMRFWCAGHA